ncbi:hypothetical protein [Blastococcus sp. TF02A-26]|uniref:hypothetical protein n=1 Tax=Blastococcus sp. TF02A-26 TaxID=2250577 RepID=UPI000DEABD9D|nr:hypothetical protein [Blastococcus sp. TF02A-26]RBY90570.1 hypothetical protein DQ240_00320 [Blastococcus sp. TF02A-26]
MRTLRLREGRAAWMVTGIGAVSGVGLGVLTTALSPQSVQDGVDLSGLVNLSTLGLGLLGVVLGLCLELVLRLDIRSNVEIALNDLPREHRPEVSELVVRVLEYQKGVRAYSPQLQKAALTALHEAERELRELASGRFESQPGPAWLKQKLAAATRTLHAVTDSGDLEWWRTPEKGRAFLAAHEEKIQRGFQVERVFLTDPHCEEDMRRLAEEHRAIGVQCWLVDRTTCPGELCENVTIFDWQVPGSRAMHRDQVGRDGRTTRYVHSENEGDIRRTMERFESLKRRGEWVAPGAAAQTADA